MKLGTIFQSYATYKPNVLVRLFKENNNCILCDLEDSIQDPDFPENNFSLKERARKDLSFILKKTKKKINIRINSIHSPFFIEDLHLLEKFDKKISSIFIPKIESSDDINIFYQKYGRRCKINPIIETKIGVENIENILSSKYKSEFQFVFFGNYDFHLDKKIFPINEQYSRKYWDTVLPLIIKIEEQGLKFGNSAYANINDENTNRFIVRQLKKKCKNKFALISLHNKQSEIINNELSDICKNISNHYIYENNSSQSSLEDYSNTKQKGRSFAFYNGSIITPQEYLLLKENGKY